MIKEFYDRIAVNGSVPVETLVEMTQNGVLQIRKAEDAVFTIAEVAKIFDKDSRTVARWVEEGKIKAINGVTSKVIPAKELERFYETMAVSKSKTCIYVQADTVSEVNENVNRIVEKIGVNKYRCNIFADIDGNDGFEALLKFLIKYKGIVYTNVSLVDKGEYIGLILSVTNTTVQLI